MANFEDLAEKVFPLIRQYEKISDSQIVDFFTGELWDNCVPEKIKKLYEENESPKLEKTDLRKHICVEEFYESVSTLYEFVAKELEKSSSIQELEKMLEKDEGNEQKFHKVKKWHEIEKLSRMIKLKIGEERRLIIDAGAGKGYLSTYISQHYNMPVLAVESSGLVFHSALNYKDLLVKKTQHSYQEVKYVKEHIDESTDYSAVAKYHFPNVCTKDNLCLVGLHTCGSLVYSMVKSFLGNRDMKMLCVVPCCYHLADASFGHHLSRNQRMLAQQRLSATFDANSYHPSLFYRAVLQVVLNSLGLNKAKIGRGLFHEDFAVYVNRALTKLGIPSENIPSGETLKEIYCTYTKELLKFNIFHTLRLILAPLLETAILLDIALHLQKSEHCKNVEIVHIFDSAISPRSHCIVATK